VDRAKPFDIPSEGQLIDPIARGSVGRCYSAASLTDFCRRVAYAATPDAAIDAEELQARGADAILLDCIGFTQRHREALLLLATPIILSNAVVVKALSQLPGG
jgi:AroM protein